MKNISFIGTGVMGASIVKHLLQAGYPVTVHTRTKAKAEPLLTAGAKWASTVAGAVQGADLIFTMVGMPDDVEEIYLNGNGILANGTRGQIVVDMTTSSPALAKEIDQAAAERGMASLDAPVSGGDVGAKNGTLSIMCGGEETVFESVKPIFSLFGSRIIRQGGAGAGQHTKMSNQLAIATNMIGVCEALAYAEKAGLDLERVLESISPGAAGSWSLSNLGPRMLAGNFEPGFYTKHFLKDLRIALDEARNMNLELPGLQLAARLYEDLMAKGYGDKGTQVLFKHYQS
ncbi:NAD(P)-dependent oxidoreductase [Sporosarcina gallistercoris]|uniref:NAD(P)-dependent oxidoreductase n=1 Tax=Sporosarcina gallistercoris TaxID=2762245 RepID=A0ABR8PGK1_9BACL|nr:NAD(P)-dependent oxidoreductase [Sporosarcina gallistercoris]MBD7907294.1 NAD(P)-dependent oxidoreductase [Sporosarcina gallistercoris]